MSDLNLAHFYTQLDLIGQIVLFTLSSMSLTSWTVIVFKLIQLRTTSRQRSRFFNTYRQTATPITLSTDLQNPQEAGYTKIALIGLQALSRWNGRSKRRVLNTEDSTDFVSTRLALAVARERERLESGLALLAAIGSTAPFVGLLGTVWGIYHALITIGLTGQASLDKVAGPVGEALIMTAIGLTVAIPAVLAYNTFSRLLQKFVGELEEFAHELLSFMATGVHAQQKTAPQQYTLETTLMESI
jgi:biopolymer transport protein ExbB